MNNLQMLQYNRQLLLFHLFRLRRAGITELAHLMELSIPAVSRLVKGLCADGLTRLNEENASGRGKNAGLVELTATDEAIVCLDIRPTEICALLSDHYGEPLTKLQRRPLALTTPQGLIDDVAAAIQSCMSAAAARGLKVGACAVACHGQVDAVNGVSMVMPQAPWHAPVHLKYLLEQRLQLRVEVDNDCVMRALAQKWALLKKTADCQDFCVINADYGIGSSFLINQEIYRGQLYGSGQIGHTIVDPHGRLCSCGRVGCLETVASKGAMLQTVNEYLRAVCGRAAVDFDGLAALYQGGDPAVVPLINQAAVYLGRSIYNFLNVININHIFLYGCVQQLGAPFLAVVRQQALHNPFDRGEEIKALTTLIEYGTLSEAQQTAGISFLIGEESFRQPQAQQLSANV